MYIKRLIEKTLLSASETFPVVILTGARQSGKTTLLKHLFEKTHTYLSLDEMDIRMLAVSDPRAFLTRYPSPVIIDEIQNAPILLSYIKAIVDREKKHGLFILTGSQQFSVMKNISESLAGRAAILNLYPFMLEEIKGWSSPPESDPETFLKDISAQSAPDKTTVTLGKLLLNGGYPSLFTNNNISRNLWFSSYIQTYIDRDIRGNIREENVNDFERLLKLLASRTSQELSYSSLSRDLGLSVPTIKNWISILESNSIVYLLQPYHRNFGKRIIKSPKLYFLDCGLASYLSGLQSEEHLLNGPMAGALFETFVITNFLKRFKSLDNYFSLYYWKNIGGVEIDLIIESGLKLFPAEIKMTATIYGRHYASLIKWLEYSDMKEITNGLVISNSVVTGKISSRIYGCHWYNI